METKNNSFRGSILVIRFSAMGDVAMTVPVLTSLAASYPKLKITFLSNPKFAPMFRNVPANLKFRGADVHGEYHGNSGIKRLVKELDRENYEMIADLHGVIRSRLITRNLKHGRMECACINKDRVGRWALTRQHLKRSKPLTPSIERYRQVFRELGFRFDIKFGSIFGQKPQVEQLVNSLTGNSISGKYITIAPFAAHIGKTYPMALMEQVVAQIDNSARVTQFIFAYGKEKESIEHWESKYKSVKLIGGLLTFEQELELISGSSVMLSMDSANMHLASLVGTPAVSVWGATHPKAGFLGYGQKEEDCIQTNLACRPCSIYGKKECRFKTYQCMNSIDPQCIINQLLKYV